MLRKESTGPECVAMLRALDSAWRIEGRTGPEQHAWRQRAKPSGRNRSIQRQRKFVTLVNATAITEAPQPWVEDPADWETRVQETHMRPDEKPPVAPHRRWYGCESVGENGVPCAKVRCPDCANSCLSPIIRPALTCRRFEHNVPPCASNGF